MLYKVISLLYLLGPPHKPSTVNTNISLGLIVRFYRGELPYVKAFLEHYIELGFDHIYVFIQDTSDYECFERKFSQYSQYTKLIKCPNNVGARQGWRLSFNPKEINANYLLICDFDEYLYLPSNINLKKFIKMLGWPTSISIPWIMAPVDFEPANQRVNGYLGHTGKQLANVGIIKSIKSEHNFNIKLRKRNENRVINPPGIFLVHYWGRTFRDIIIKLIFQNLGDQKLCGLDQIFECLKNKSLPNRLKMLAGLCVQQRYMFFPNLLGDNVDLLQEDRIVSEYLSSSQLQKIENIYSEYKTALGKPSSQYVYPMRNNVFGLLDSLP